MAAEVAAAEIEAGMLDIDPPAPVLRLDAPRIMKVGIKVGTASLGSFADQLNRYNAARPDREARLGALIDAAVSVGCRITAAREEGGGLVADLRFDAEAALARIRELRIADGDLAYALDAAL